MEITTVTRKEQLMKVHVHVYGLLCAGICLSEALVFSGASFINIFLKNIFWGDFFFVLYSALLHLPPLRFHCADGCWYGTLDSCNWCIGSQTL